MSSTPYSKTVVIVWMRAGPYHLARAQALLEALVALGYRLELCEISSRDQYDWTLREERPAWVTTRFPSSEYRKIGRGTIRASILEYLSELSPSVVISNGWSAVEARAALDWARSNRGCIPIVMSETKADDGVRYWWKETAKRLVLRGVRAGLVGGIKQADYLASLGVPRENIFLGYNAVDNRYFELAAAKQRVEAGSCEPYFFASSRFLARKNLDGLLRAYADYRSLAAEPWGLVIAGSGEEEGNLRTLCTSLGLDSHVRWPGFVQYDKLPHWYAGAGAFIHPAKAEAWGLVVNEAAACSLPLLVAEPVGARYELVEEGVNGFSFDPHSDRAMSDVMLKVASMSDAERRQFGAAAKARVDQFGPERFAQGLLSAIEAARASPR